MSRGLTPFLSRSSIFMPACLARRCRAASTAGIVPCPGSPSPSASVTQFIELAVYMPEQDPQPGQAQSSSCCNWAEVIFLAFTEPTPSNTEMRSTVLSWILPASIGPPLIKMEGRLSRSAAISMPGTILSQLGMNTSASNGWAIAMISMESAINSRLAREYFMPAWFMAMPSQTPMTGNSTGVPPAMRMPAFTSWVIKSR